MTAEIVTRILATKPPIDNSAGLSSRHPGSMADAVHSVEGAPSPPQILRIITFLHDFAPGGVERIAARLHGAWRARGVDARIVLADARRSPPQPLDHVAQAGRRSWSGVLTRPLALILGTRARVKAEQPHILFCAGNTYTLVAVMLRVVLGRNCPPIVAKISNCLVRPDMHPLVRLFYRKWLRIQGRYLDHFVGMAPAMRGEIAAMTGAAQGRISVIEDPALCVADLTRLATARDGAARDRPGRHFLAIGRFAPQKNFALLLDAFARIATGDDTLTILGDGPERAALERRAADLGVTAALRLPGHVDPLDRWLATAHALVMSSDYEGVPAVIIEALAAGLPIVATDCCVSMADLLGHGALGKLVAVGDAAGLAAAMASIGPEARHVATARRAAAARFTIEHATEKYLGLMRTLAEARAARDVAVNIPRSDPVPSRAA